MTARTLPDDCFAHLDAAFETLANELAWPERAVDPTERTKSPSAIPPPPGSATATSSIPDAALDALDALLASRGDDTGIREERDRQHDTENDIERLDRALDRLDARLTSGSRARPAQTIADAHPPLCPSDDGEPASPAAAGTRLRLMAPRSGAAAPLGASSEAHGVFGQEVFAAFPSAQHDILEAGLCYRLGRYTASVFHTTRAAERGLAALAASANAKASRHARGFASLIAIVEARLVTIESWQAGRPRTGALEFFGPSLDEARVLRNAARALAIDTSTPRTEHDALLACHVARALFVRLAARITEAQSRTLGRRDFI